ncbi:Hypothetical protein HVR_LOCUS515 [uncultured virus]|nr:Hypothetical protein HVR_LOCUS515 [uncultured virus]
MNQERKQSNLPLYTDLNHHRQIVGQHQILTSNNNLGSKQNPLLNHILESKRTPVLNQNLGSKRTLVLDQNLGSKRTPVLKQNSALDQNLESKRTPVLNQNLESKQISVLNQKRVSNRNPLHDLDMDRADRLIFSKIVNSSKKITPIKQGFAYMNQKSTNTSSYEEFPYSDMTSEEDRTTSDQWTLQDSISHNKSNVPLNYISSDFSRKNLTETHTIESTSGLGSSLDDLSNLADDIVLPKNHGKENQEDKQEDKPEENQQDKPAENQGDKPAENQGDKPAKNQEDKPAKNQEDKPEENQEGKPEENQQDKPEEDNKEKDNELKEDNKRPTISYSRAKLNIDELHGKKESNLSEDRNNLVRNYGTITPRETSKSERPESSMPLGEAESIDLPQICRAEAEMLHLKTLGLEHQQIFNMIDMRCKLAQSHRFDNPILRPTAYHEKYVDAYTKGLPHDGNGFVDIVEMHRLLTALKDNDRERLATIRLGSKNRLVNPSAAWSLDFFGANSNCYRYSTLPALSSDLMAAQMTELYCMSRARDARFSKYRTNEIIAECCSHLNDLRAYPQVKDRVTPYNIFRGPMYSDTQGIYLSQFLYRDIRIGGFVNKQKYATDLEGHDFMKTWETAISAQSGNILEHPAPQRDISRYIITGRDLACYVHYDEPYQAFYNASMILLDMKASPNPEIARLLNETPMEGFFVDFGRSDIQATISMIGRNALLAAWYVKWNTLFLRPEAYGIEVERIFRNKRNRFGISPELLRNPVLQAVQKENGNTLLSQVYEEGSPNHPSTPSGHGAIAGACITILKFFFDVNFEMDVFEPDADGQILIKNGQKTTVGIELDKLATNIAIGRNWAGIHYWMDAISGIKLGEKVAISCLRDLIHKYPMKVRISFPRFNEKVVTIEN